MEPEGHCGGRTVETNAQFNEDSGITHSKIWQGQSVRIRKA
jgi:hypothetical protein